MPDLHQVEPRIRQAFPDRAGLEGAAGEGPWFSGSGVKDLGHIAAGR